MPGKIWSEQEKKKLKAHFKKGGNAENCRLKGRSYNAILNQAKRLGLVNVNKGSKSLWSQKELNELRRLQGLGFTPQQIFNGGYLGQNDTVRTLWAIRKRWGRDELADEARSQGMKNKKDWAEGELAEFKQYLRQYSSQETPEEIAIKWGVARSTVVRHQIELGVRLTREQVMKLPHSRKKRREQSKRMTKTNLERWTAWRASRVKKLEELAASIRENNPHVKEKVCTDCGRSWPRKKEFFPITEKKISIGTSRYFKGRCCICESKKRRARKAAREVKKVSEHAA